MNKNMKMHKTLFILVEELKLMQRMCFLREKHYEIIQSVLSGRNISNAMNMFC